MGDYRNTLDGPGDLGLVPTAEAEAGEIEYEGDVDVFETQLIDGLSYTIEMLGADTGDGNLSDPLLLLTDDFGTVLAEDDQSGEGSNALIDYTADYSGAHYLSATGFDPDDLGDYLVFVSSGAGTDDDDTIRGTSFADAVRALDGDDLVRGRRGADSLEGGDGEDDLLGGGGDDFLDGGRDGDAVEGQNGADILYGGSGGDYVEGGRGFDILRGQGGDDVLRGGFDGDLLIGGSGDDVFEYLTVDASPFDDRDVLERGNRGDAFDRAGDDFGDVFDLSAIDADEGRRGDQDFDFDGTSGGGRRSVWLRTTAATRSCSRAWTATARPSSRS
jgi:hypothetical protein